MLRAVSFDLFDTLVDLSFDARAAADSLDALFARARAERELSREEFATALSGVDERLRLPRLKDGRELPTLERFAALAQALGLEAPALPAAWTRAHMGVLQAQVRAQAHHPALLESLRARGLRLGVCSNFSHSETARRVLEEARLQELCDAVLISEDVRFRKPRPEIFEAVQRALDVAPGETLHVGDNLHEDIAGAARAGFRTAWITRRVAKPVRKLARYRGPRPDYIIADLGELAELDALPRA